MNTGTRASGWVRGYTRKSRALGDKDDPELMAKHLGTILKMASDDGVTLRPEDVVLEVRSGARLNPHSGFGLLLSEVERLPPGSGGALYITELSRLSRGTDMEVARIKDAFKRAGIRIRTPLRLFDPASPADSLLYDILFALARNELAQYADRVAMARREMTRQGKLVTGKAPFGYRWSKADQQLFAHEPEFSVAARLFQEAPTHSVRQLAEKYGLSPSNVGWILRNPVYTGWPHRHSYMYASPNGWEGTKRLPREKWILCEQPGNYPPAVSVDLFEAVQQVMDTRRDTRPKCATPNGWCRDVLRLFDPYGEMHAPCSLESIGGRRLPRPTYTYRLPDRPRLYVDRELVHIAAERALAASLASPGLLHEALATHLRSMPPEPEEESHSAILSRVSRIRVNLDELLVRELEAERDEERDSIARVRDAKHRELETLIARLQPKPKKLSVLDLEWLERAAPSLSRNFAAAWAAVAEPERRKAVGCILESVDVTLEPIPGQRQWRREVTGIEYQEYVQTYMVKRGHI